MEFDFDHKSKVVENKFLSNFIFGPKFEIALKLLKICIE